MKKNTYILGISCFYHDSAACLLKDGAILAAAQEERFTRKKHDASFPLNSIQYCLDEAQVSIEFLDHIVFYEKPFLKFDRIMETFFTTAPWGFKNFSASFISWIKDKVFLKLTIERELNKLSKIKKNWFKKIFFSEHHLSHASSAYFPSPFDDAAIITIDGVGEWATSSVFVGSGNMVSKLEEINFPHSIGLLYSAFTYYLGFKVNSGEYKVMGLAPYGVPIYTNLIKKNLIKIFEDGSFQLNLKYFSFISGLTMTNNKFNILMGGPPREPESKLIQKHMDIAASIQKVTEELIVKIAKHVKQLTRKDNLCLAGGVALNCVANGLLAKEKIFKNLWIQPASGDAGGSLGAALAFWYMYLKKPRLITKDKDQMQGSFLGPRFSNKIIESELNILKASFKKYDDNDLYSFISKSLINGKVVGWFQGRMEFGPRALGARSIIADPRQSDMQKKINLKIKFRESFRPFAPSILKEETKKWFNHIDNSPYMLLVTDIKNNKKIKSPIQNKSKGLEKLNTLRSTVPSVTHVDYSSRIHTVDSSNKRFYNLIKEFYKQTGCPMLINTSFNIRGEPLVCSIKDAFNCFINTEMDVLVIENFILIKEDQRIKSDPKILDKYELD